MSIIIIVLVCTCRWCVSYALVLLFASLSIAVVYMANISNTTRNTHAHHASRQMYTMYMYM